MPRTAMLDTWAQGDWSEACDLASLPALQVLTVETANTIYEIVIVSGADGDVLVQGGHFFPSRRAAHLAGSSMGGSFLKLRTLHVGLCMELYTGGQIVVTSPVRSIWIHDAVPHTAQ